jgi:ectoine hydroxylase-related dioxygenase (phytanoyl-CoA dioxygenase family)
MATAAEEDLFIQLDRLRPDFERDGAVCVRGAFSRHWLDILAGGMEENLANPGPWAKHYTADGKPGRFFGDYCNWRRIAGYRDFLLHSPAAEIAGTLMGSRKVNLFHEHVLVKEPGTEEPTPWHHDQPYWTVDGTQVCSIWLPLDPVARDTAVEFVAGSHRWGKWYSPASFADAKSREGTGFEPVPDIAAHPDQYDLIGWDLALGDCIVFHGLTLHGAPGNARKGRRRAFASRWTGDDVRFVLRQGYMSPPPPDDAPPVGAPMDSDVYPVVWQAADHIYRPAGSAAS